LNRLTTFFRMTLDMLFDLAAFGMETLTSLSASCKKALMQEKSPFFQPAVIIDKALLSEAEYMINESCMSMASLVGFSSKLKSSDMVY
jgi:hypothetical protein